MPVDAVLSYHMNPYTCGVAKFNHALAKRLGVSFSSLRTVTHHHPLVSIKPEELSREAYIDVTLLPVPYDLFLHGVPGASLVPTVTRADRVYAANVVIAEAIRSQRPDVITAWCPSTIDGDPTRAVYRVLTFGMAHKLALQHFRKLKVDLDRDHPQYTIEFSTAVHEGSPWDEALTRSVEAMRGIFGDHLRVLGYLADDALAKELNDCDAVAVFFEPAFRANNTTAWAVLAAGKTLYTNIDAQSPEPSPARYSWDALIETMTT